MSSSLVTAWRSRMKGRHALWSSPLLAPLGVERPLAEMVEPLSLGNEPVELGVQTLLAGRLLVLGGAGSGKSTWLQLAFRRLLDHGALPLLADLRDLASQQRPSLDAWLQAELARQVPESAELDRALLRLSSDRGAPGVVVLLDGWDELGEAGRELREQLVGLAATYPRLGLVVASRPAACGLPRSEDDFRTLSLQPLDGGQLKGLVARLVRVCVEPGRREAVVERFLDALERSPQARALAGRPLLLQFMLLLSPEDPLPKRRHRLYASCIEALLESRRADPELGTPHERLQALAAFASRLQDRPGASVPELSRALPADWSPGRRQAFLAWLAGPAGLLEQRGLQLHFLHPSLREYLAALHLFRTVSPAQRHGGMLALAARPASWEVLRLWVAMVEDEDGGCAPLVEALLEGGVDQLLLAGCLVADGLAAPHQARRVFEGVVDTLEQGWPPRMEALAQALASGPERPMELAMQLAVRAPEQGWPGWLRFHELALDADLGVELPRPQGLAGPVVDVVGGHHDDARAIALGRMFSGASPLWPGTWWQVSLLQVWPSPRLERGRWMQRLASLGVPAEQLASLPPPPSRHSPDWERWLRSEWTGFLDDHGTYAPAERWAHRLALSDPRSPEPMAHGSALRLLADSRTPDRPGGAVALLREAARKRLGMRNRLLTVARRKQKDPLWTALARVLGGVAQAEHVDLLEQLATHPERRDGPLAWGLQFLVRGDVWMPDGRVLTLEELGLQLPLLAADLQEHPHRP